MRARPIACLISAALWGGGAAGQEAVPAPPVPNVWPVPHPAAAVTPLLTVDQERLFAESAFGKAAQRALEDESRALAAENRRIETELVEEERALTDLRKTLPADDFRKRAQAFDEKVVRIRQEQDAKSRDLGRRTDEDRKRLLQAAVPILAQLVAERGAVAVLDVRAVLIASSQIDITDDAITRLDTVLGEDSGAEERPIPPVEGAPGTP
ncbi:OmpH family outer membrane protein [Haematobacter genomosp. 1]|uniref:Outer membrane chaperone Skp n=1 Tax=Haematobacter genomosp. 1 TaxID=366618 RepID=A0A212ACV9_9RHOB|nr:OmpH family outer membrane protein [Haematobacter genomosp. 1]OWJ78861.1 outer membrane chaperone Skp [Haematobacter genomosp. 1]